MRNVGLVTGSKGERTEPSNAPRSRWKLEKAREQFPLELWKEWSLGDTLVLVS